MVHDIELNVTQMGNTLTIWNK